MGFLWSFLLSPWDRLTLVSNATILLEQSSRKSSQQYGLCYWFILIHVLSKFCNNPSLTWKTRSINRTYFWRLIPFFNFWTWVVILSSCHTQPFHPRGDYSGRLCPQLHLVPAGQWLGSGVPWYSLCVPLCSLCVPLVRVLNASNS